MSVVERAARALFEHVFRNLPGRFDGNDKWETAEEPIKAGFRREVIVVLGAAGMTLVDREWFNDSAVRQE